MPSYLSQPGVLDETIGKSTIANSKKIQPLNLQDYNIKVMTYIKVY